MKWPVNKIIHYLLKLSIICYVSQVVSFTLLGTLRSMQFCLFYFTLEFTLYRLVSIIIFNYMFIWILG